MSLSRNTLAGVCLRMRRKPPRLQLRASILLLGVATLMVSSIALAGNLDKVVYFRIKAKTLETALLQVGEQAHVQIVFASKSPISNMRAMQIKGRYTAREAIALLLTGSTFRLVDSDGTAEIVPNANAQTGEHSRLSNQADLENKNTHKERPRKDPKSTLNISTKGYTKKYGVTKLREVIVTAEKYQQRAFNVPIDLQVLTGSQVLEQGITDLSNLQYAVPGLYMNSTGYTHSIYLRGVGNTIGNGAMVGEYIDDADITAEGINGTQGYASGDNAIYDVKRIEILKGPQGTLYGDGSMGGVIRYITNKPALNNFKMSADGAESFTQYGSPSQRTEIMLNAPVDSGSFGLRFAGLFEHAGGWVDEPVADKKNINSGNITDVRIEARWLPAHGFHVNAMQIIHRHTAGLGMGEDASGNITPVFFTNSIPTNTDSSNITNVTATYNFKVARLVSSSTYFREQQDVSNVNVSESFGHFTYWILYPKQSFSDRDYSEELRLVHSDGGQWRWVVGAFYKDFRYKFSDNYYFGPAGAQLSSRSVSFGTLPPEDGLSASWAGFANVSYNLLARLSFGVGARYFTDHETLAAADFPFSTANFSSTDPRFYVRYRVTTGANIYASASKGFRSGGFNYPPTPPYQPETLWSYDLGAKVRKPMYGVQANVDTFLSNYMKYVQSTDNPPLFPYENVGNARIEGVDADLTWQLSRQWSVSWNTELLRTYFVTASENSGYRIGDRLPFAPKYSFTAKIVRAFTVEGRHGRAQIYYYELSDVQVRAPGLPVSRSNLIRLLDARLSVDWSKNLRLAIFAHNLLNDRGLQSPDANAGESVRPRPRTLGIEFNVDIQ